jgi:hypothetical protein
VGGSDRWFLDHLFIDGEGIPTLVEVKRGSDTRIRREVVGQMLDYAANAVVHWPIETIREQFEQRCEREGLDPAELVLRHVGSEGEEDDESEGDDPVEQFWGIVRKNFQTGTIRLVFVADRIPAELRRIVEFLNQQMDPAEVLALEVRQFAGQGARTLVPRIYGREAVKQARRGSGERWSEERLLQEIEQRIGAEGARVAADLIAWSQDRADYVHWGSGAKRGNCIPVIQVNGGRGSGGHNVQLFGVNSRGRVVLWFVRLKKKPPFDQPGKLGELAKRLSEIDGVQISETDLDRKPSIPLKLLVKPDAMKKFRAAIEWMIEQARGEAA